MNKLWIGRILIWGITAALILPNLPVLIRNAGALLDIIFKSQFKTGILFVILSSAPGLLYARWKKLI